MMKVNITNKRLFPIVSQAAKWGMDCDSNKTCYENLDPTICPLTMDEVQELKDSGYDIPSHNIGDVLCLYPYAPNKLIHIEKSEELTQEKFQIIVKVLNDLGAKCTTLSAYITHTEELKIDAKGKITIKGNTLSGFFKKHKKVTAEGFTQVVGENSKEWNPQEGIPDAINYAKRYGVYEDLKHVISARESHRPIGNVRIHINISQEHNCNIKANASLKGFANAFKLNGNFGITSLTLKTLEINQDVAFEDPIKVSNVSEVNKN